MAQQSSRPGRARTAESGRGAAARSTRGIDYQDIPRPIAGLADEYAAGFIDPFHSHKRAQLLYASTGVTSVTTEQATFVVPPQRAVWIPSGVAHEVHCRGHVSVRTLYIDPQVRSNLPTTCQVLDISSLLRELILEALTLPIEYDVAGRDGRIMELILDEIVSAPVIALHVPMPENPRLLRICRAILANPA